MANKRISDFPTLEEALDDDLILVSSSQETYNMKVKTLKDATRKVADDAVTQAQNAQAQAAAASVAASNAESDAAAARQKSDDLERECDIINDTLLEKVDGAYVENGYLYMTAADEVVV